jgi:predicted NBD/HSP70 family sugar kinase
MVNRSNDLRQNNRRLIIREILTNESVSRQDIISRTGLAASTVSSITAEILKEEILRKSGNISSPGTGRKTDLFMKNGPKASVIVINLTFDSCKIALVDLELNISRSTKLLINNLETETVVKILSDQLYLFIREIKNVNLKAIVLALPHYPYEKEVICEKLSENYKLPVLSINNVEAMGMFDSHYLYSTVFQSLVYIYIGKGIGSSFFHKGELFVGENGYASDLGHIHITDKPLLCRCGRKGCLETVSSEDALLENMIEMGIIDKDHFEGDFVQILQEGIDRRDPGIQNLLSSMAGYMAEAILTVNSLLDPQAIILTGRILELNPFFSLRLQEQLYEKSGRRSLYSNTITFQKYRPDSAVQGAALYAFLTLYSG